MVREALPSDLAKAVDLGGELGRMFASYDWAAHPLGDPADWSPAKRAVVAVTLTSRFPTILWLGDSLYLLYNDAYIPVLGDKHPASFATPAVEVWWDVWDEVGPMLAGAVETGVATWSDDLLLMLVNDGRRQERYFTFTYGPIFGADGRVEGVFTPVTETTDRVLSERRLQTLNELSASLMDLQSVDGVLRVLVEVFATHHADLPFVALTHPSLAGTCVGTPNVADLVEAAPAAFFDGLRGFRMVEDLRAAIPGVVERLGENCPEAAVVFPLDGAADDSGSGSLCLALSRYRPFDAQYRGFCRLVTDQVNVALANAAAYEAEQRRAEALAEIDRAKTRLLQNVSHELRTPLTLVAGSHEALLEDPGVTGDQRQQVEVADRATRRLRRLVDALLDVSRAADARLRVTAVPTDAGQLTEDVVAMFRSSIESAGLYCELRVGEIPPAVELDPEVWSRVLSNLVSNAFKFTSDGGITVEVAAGSETLDLVVSDSGTGIPADEQDRVFDRFHQVAGASSRTAEGAGIGLALVRDLIEGHGGTVTVESRVGEGSTFTVSLPLVTETTVPASDHGAAVERSRSLADDAASWLPDMQSAHRGGVSVSDRRVLVIEDNADMRAHLRRILESDGWEVDAVGDVITALGRPEPPLLVVSDVMLPGIDGIELVRIMRAAPDLTDVPVIMLTARAGPGSAADGLAAGATDYLTKPFDAAELRARVRTHAATALRRRAAVEKAETTADNLQVALASSREIGAAIGIVMAGLQVTQADAFAILRETSQSQNRKLKDIAAEIVLTGEIPTPLTQPDAGRLGELRAH